MEEKQVQRVLERIREAESWRDSNYRSLWEDCLRRYRSQVKQKREGSNLFVPHTFMQCEVIKARVNETLFATRPYLAVLPREGNDTVKAEKLQMLLDWQMNERMDLARLLGEEVVGNVIIYGTGITYTGWQVKTRRVTEARYEDRLLTDAAQAAWAAHFSLPQRSTVQTEQVVWDDPVVVNIPLTDFYVDPKAQTVEEARFCGHKEPVTREMLADLEAQGKYCIDWDHLQTMDEADAAADFFDSGDSKEMYLLHHYWEDDRHLVFLNRSQCICEEENPFWHGEKPYDKACYVPLEGSFYGMGIPELLAGLQDELNTCRNQRIDFNSMALRRMWKLRKGSGLTARDLLWRQNGVLQVENMDDIQEINTQNLPADAFANEAGVKQDMQDVTGCHDILMGVAYSGETATTTMTRDNNASLRFKSVVRCIIKDLLVPIARKCVAMDRQFLSAERAVRLLGEGGGDVLSVCPQDLCGEYDVIYCGAALETMANREVNKERALQAYSLALADPAYQRDDAARLKLFEKVLRGLGLADAEQLLPRQDAAAEAVQSVLPQQVL